MTPEERIAALEAEVAGLTARLAQLEQKAFIFTAAEDILDLTYRGAYAQGQADILGMDRHPAGRKRSTPARRAANPHLRAVE